MFDDANFLRQKFSRVRKSKDEHKIAYESLNVGKIQFVKVLKKQKLNIS